MPAIFYREAYEAAAGRAPDVAVFETWEQLAKALDKLTPEQRCDAVYADWLLQLHSPAHPALLQIRNLLISQGALAANYLAELAQNADDAAVAPDAEVRIVLDGDWLFVSNNGRKMTSMNLLGLCRFFVHAAGRIRELNEETIGRFGIGFKSSYRIASEVLVHTWEGNDGFAFRLPVCRKGEPASHPNSDRLKHLRTRLMEVGIQGLENAFGDVESLGYCTPEYVAALPSDVGERTASLRQSKQGTLFCFHLRPDKLPEVHQRIARQAHVVYELCPLFLPKLSLVQLGPNTLRMAQDRLATVDLPGVVEADKVTLTTSAPNEPQSHSRFWRLRGVAPGDLWQVALHADGKFRLRVEQEEDEHGTTIKDGAAYAYFPMNAVTWPFRLHLHIKLPTNLARNDWNPDEDTQVRQQIHRAVAGTAQWLEQHTDKWHPEWRIESLVDRRPNRNEIWAWHLWDCFRSVVQQRILLRSIGGNLTTAANSKTVALLGKLEVRAAWRCVLSKLPRNSLSLVEAIGDAEFVSGSVSANELAELCAAAVAADPQNPDIHQMAITALLGASQVSLSAVEDLVAALKCNRKSGEVVSLRQLLEEPAGTELSASWHSTFARLARWAADSGWRDISVCGTPLRSQLQKLAIPVFNPTWEELPVRLADESMWQHHGDVFWRTPRSECPNGLCDSALSSMRAQVPDGTWVSLTTIWPLVDNHMGCLGGAFKACAGSLKYPTRQVIANCLDQWGLYVTWLSSAQDRLATLLPEEITSRLTGNSATDAFAVVFNREFQDAYRRLPSAWKAAANEAQKAGVRKFLAAQQQESPFTGKTLASPLITPAIRSALCLSPEFYAAPCWLTDEAWRLITELGLSEACRFDYLTASQVASRRAEFGRKLLEEFHRWPGRAPTESEMAGLAELCAAASPSQRRDWLLGLGPKKSRRLRDLIAPSPVAGRRTVRSRLREILLKKAEWRGEPLPVSLVALVPIAEVCIQPEKLEPDPVPGTLTPIDPQQLAPEIGTLPEIRELVIAGSCTLLGSPKPLNLKWRYDGEIVATLDNAEFVIEADQLIVHQFRPPADEKQCQRILDVFETNAVASADYQADAALAPYERYQKHRDIIRRTLLKELVSKVGYEKHHILRELLQNAESAYASKQDKPTEAWFEFVVEAAGNAGRRKVSARHAGRAFNEPDSAGHERHDVERIWRLAAENERTPDEVGRFNRGFKTVFSVATNGSVRIRSGDFDFEVIDLLMLKPAEPKPNPANHSPLTEFLFEAEYGHALEMFRIDAAPGPAAALPILNPASFVFLGYLQRVTVKFEQRVWQWRIVRRVEGNGWSQIAISTEGVPQAESFLVFAGTGTKLKPDAPERRYAAAVRLGPNGLPVSLDKAWRKFRLTFETEHDFPLDFLVNGDFEADQGRVALRHIARSGLVELAYDAVLLRAQQEIRAKPTKEVWLAWARVLHLRQAATELETSSELRTLRQQASKAAEFFTQNIPHVGGLVSASELEFPTALFRRLAGLFGTSWGINMSRWIDVEIAAALPDTEQRKHSFHGWLNGLDPEAPILRIIQRDLELEKFTKLKLSGQEPEELKEAKQVLEEKLRPVALPPPPVVELPEVEAWTATNLWHWWERQGKPVTDYTLEGGENWRLFYTDDLGNTQFRRERLKQDLLATTTDAGKRVWYRLFGLACLMSAGRRMTELREFWHGELDARQFWESTSGTAFGRGTDALFDDLMQHRFANLIASGEHAYFWRRVFYDLRKIHKLVWEEGFPDTMLRLVQAGRGGELLNFLKTGTLSGQRSWVGVFGQSAGAPLFFLVRELCRLGVITDPQVQPLAFFISTPVRRAMARIGWLGVDSSESMDFESLSSISTQLHAMISGNPEFGPKLLPYYDIPLLHLGLNG